MGIDRQLNILQKVRRISFFLYLGTHLYFCFVSLITQLIKNQFKIAGKLLQTNWIAGKLLERESWRGGGGAAQHLNAGASATYFSMFLYH